MFRIRIRIPPFHFDSNSDKTCHFDADPDSAFSLDEVRIRIRIKAKVIPPQVLNNADSEPAFDFDADPDPAFHFDADPDPASQNDPDPCCSRSGCRYASLAVVLGVGCHHKGRRS